MNNQPITLLFNKLYKRPSLFKQEEFHSTFTEKTILITGAAGSIGSRLASQISKYNIHSLILIDQAETPIVLLKRQLDSTNKKIFYYLNSITDQESLEDIFSKHEPEIVINTAAYKHVSFLESNIKSAFEVNVKGSIYLHNLSIKYNTRKFIHISTDKAVYPKCKMGITKRISELLLLNSEGSPLQTNICRFGNVFGSNGSVVPIFIKQIENNQQLTVTNESASRYFMSFEEVNLLIFKSISLEKQNVLYSFNMGSPLNILELAKEILNYYYKTPHEEYIKFTGLTKGEKMNEVLHYEHENLTEISPQIYQINSTNNYYTELQLLFDKLNLPDKYISEFLELINSSTLNDYR